MIGPFQNEAYGDFHRPERRAAMQAALSAVRGRLGLQIPLYINGSWLPAADTFDSVDPARPATVVGRVAAADQAQADAAVRAADRAFPAWSRTPVELRVGVLLRAAAIMRREKDELVAWMIFEAGKSWHEADADVAEAIDFLEWYARSALELQGRTQPLIPFPGESNVLSYLPLGPGLAIPPWNFPLAIATTLTVAPLVAGNTVVLKPSPRTPVMSYHLVRILEQAGLPAGVVNLVSGHDAVLGDFLVDHPLIRFIGFTGSKAVGLRVLQRAAVRQPGQNWIKRTILEMGGKDAIVVDETADLAAAAEAAVASAFGFQGQKCSACSRLIIVDSVYDQVVELVAERTRHLSAGFAEDPASYVTPVIDQRALDGINAYIEVGRSEGRQLTGDEPLPAELTAAGGYYVRPHVFADVDPRARIAQEEIFGPVLAVIRARDFAHAIAIANDTEYGLTGGCFTRDAARLQYAREHFHVGNLYLNRKCTGALVGVQPFGGFNMSGTDSKAGGPDYVRLFTQPKVVAERL
jgi:1-pyrroline-5-carboxylate dehydrogenase